MRNWTYSKTLASTEIIECQYRRKVGDTFEDAKDTSPYTAISEVFTYYETFAYVDAEGQPQTADVVSKTISKATTTVGVANSARWKSKLEAGSPAFPGTVLTKVTESYNSYKVTSDGPVEVKLTTFEYEPLIAFAGGLAIENYKGIDLGTGNTLVRKTIVEKEEDKAADLTKETTTVYEAWGATAGGKAGAASMMEKIKKSATDAVRISNTLDLVEAMKPLVLRNVEQSINIGRGVAPTPPTEQEQQNEKLETVQDEIIVSGPWGIYNQSLNVGNLQTANLFAAVGSGTRAITNAITNAALASNKATLTFAAAHNITVGKSIEVKDLPAPFSSLNGTFSVTEVTTSSPFTLSYALTGTNIASAAVSNGVVSASLLLLDGNENVTLTFSDIYGNDD